MTNPANVGSFVVPGATVAKQEDDSLGHGITESGAGLVATVVGTLSRDDGVLFVAQSTDPIREIEVGDTVLGEVNRINPKTAEIRILHVEGKPVRTLPATHLFADIFVAKIVDRFMPSPGDAMRKRDIVRAKIETLKPMLRAECRSGTNLGVVQAICPACGEQLVASSEVPDVNVACERCDYVGFRALSNGFGHGFDVPEGSTISKLNRDGERWSDASIAFISKDGERPYLSPLSDHRRGDSHATPKDVEKFLGSIQRDSGRGGGRGGRDGGQRPRREMHAAKCTMCGIDTKLPFDPTPGVPARCSPCKEKVDNGEATKDELAEERKVLQVAREAAKATMGMKLFIGGVPYSATEEQLTEIFAAHGELKEVHIAKDHETGNSKGFAFITYKSHEEGAAAIKALKGTQIEGRKLTIQESNRGGSRGGGGGGGRGGDRRGGGGGGRGGDRRGGDRGRRDRR
jgi:CxxC-x17-CxxC domain-containing protein